MVIRSDCFVYDHIHSIPSTQPFTVHWLNMHLFGVWMRNGIDTTTQFSFIKKINARHWQLYMIFVIYASSASINPFAWAFLQIFLSALCFVCCSRRQKYFVNTMFYMSLEMQNHRFFCFVDQCCFAPLYRKSIIQNHIF